MPSIDFQAVRNLVSMQQVLVLLQFEAAVRNGDQLRGPCPIHGSSSAKSRSLSINLDKNAFQCFTCGAKGNQLDLWAQTKQLSIFEAAEDLCSRLGLPVPRLGSP